MNVENDLSELITMSMVLKEETAVVHSVFRVQECLGQEMMLYACLSLHFFTLLETAKNVVRRIVPFPPLTFIFSCFN